MTYFTLGQHRGVADDEREAIAARRRAAARSGPRACRACARSPSTRRSRGFQRRGRWKRKNVPCLPSGVRRRGTSRSAPRCRFAGESQQRLVLRQRSARPHRGNRSAGRSADGRRDWPGSGPRALRPGPRRPARSLSIVGTTTSVRDCGGMPRGKVHARQRSRRHEQRRQPVHQRDRQLARAQAAARIPSATSTPSASPSRRALASRTTASAAVHQRDRAQVERQRDRAAPSCATARGRIGRTAAARSRRGTPLVDQVEADVGAAVVVAALRPCRARRARARIALRATSLSDRRLVLGDRLDDVAVAVAGREVHPAVEPARILAQRLLDDAHRLDELAPVHRAQEAQAADAVADRDLVAGLLLVFRLDQLLDREARLGQAAARSRSAATPARRSGPAAGARAPRRRSSPSADSSAPCRRSPGSGSSDRCSATSIIWSAQASARLRSMRPAGDPHRDAAQVLDQRQAQHDRNRPQLAELERRDRLVGGDETATGSPASTRPSPCEIISSAMS